MNRLCWLVGGTEQCGVPFEGDPFGVERGLAHDQDQRPRAFQPLPMASGIERAEPVPPLAVIFLGHTSRPSAFSRSANPRTAALSALA